MLTERGIVSAPQGMGPRQIIMDQDQLVAILNGDGSGAASAGDAADAQGESASADYETSETAEDEYTEEQS
jgi:hypothetical protein